MMKPFTLILAVLLPIFAGCGANEHPIRTANQHLERGIDSFEGKSYRQAEAQFIQALVIFEQEKDFAAAAATYAHLSTVSLAQGQFRSALGYIENALQQSKKANDFRGEAKYAVIYGDVLAAMGDYDDALQRYRSSLALSTAFDDRESRAAVDLKIADALLKSRRWEEAAEYYDDALQHHRTTGNAVGIGASLAGIGDTYFRQDRYPEAQQSLLQALEAFSPSDDPVLAARINLSLGQVYRRMGDRNTALRHFRDGANRLRARRAGKEYEVTLLFSLGTMYLESDRYEEARKFFTDAAALARTEGDKIAENYLYLFIVRANFHATPQNQRSLHRERFIQNYLQIAQRFSDAGHMTGESYARIQAGELLQEAGRLNEAREEFHKAVLAEEGRVGEYLNAEVHLPYREELGIPDVREEWYYRLAGLLVQLRRTDEAFWYMEKSRSKKHFEMLQRAPIDIRVSGVKGEVDHVRAKLRDRRLLQLELTALMGNRQHQVPAPVIQQIRSELMQVEAALAPAVNSISSAHPNYLPFLQVGGMTLADVQPHIPRGTIVLQFLPTKETLYILATGRNSFEIRSSSVTAGDLNSMIREYRMLLQDPNVYAGAGGEAS
ncbi:MAG: tetratricopeptide repeat protein, partial [Bacteroidota bacterium]